MTLYLQSKTATLLSISSEYQLEALEQICAGKCGERLTIQNVRIMLDWGTTQARWIKKSVLIFCGDEPLPVVLGHPKIFAFAKENPKLWQEILMAVGGGYFEAELTKPTSVEAVTTKEVTKRDSM
jgi:hypothetical protein